MALHPRFHDAVRYLYGFNVDFRRDCIVRDDGAGPVVEQWNLPNSPPTDAEIDAQLTQIDAFMANATKDNELASLPIGARKLLFNHENRIRALEGKIPLTLAQFIVAYRLLSAPA